jgi:hypothetical protein
MTTLEVQPKAFPTSIPSTISHIQTTTGSSFILSSEIDNSSLGGDRAAQEAEQSHIESGLNFSTQDGNIGSSSRILATRRGVSGRTPKRPSGRSPFAGFATGPYRAAYRPKDVAYSRDSSPRNQGKNDTNTKFSPEDWENTFKPKEFVPSGNRSRYREVQRYRVLADGEVELLPVRLRGSQRKESPLNRDDSQSADDEPPVGFYGTDLDSDDERMAIRPEVQRRRRGVVRYQEGARPTRPSSTYRNNRNVISTNSFEDKRATIVREEYTDPTSGRRMVHERRVENRDYIRPEPQRIIVRERSSSPRSISPIRSETYRRRQASKQQIIYDSDSDLEADRDYPFGPLAGSPPNKGNELGTLSQKFGNMGWKTRKGNPMAQISSTISKDNTLGEDVRNAKLLADFAKKRQHFAFGGKQVAEKSENLTSVSDDNPFYYGRDVRDPHRDDPAVRDPDSDEDRHVAAAADRRYIHRRGSVSDEEMDYFFPRGYGDEDYYASNLRGRRLAEGAVSAAAALVANRRERQGEATYAA